MRMMPLLSVALMSAVCAAAASAQYTRTETNAAYVPRTGPGMSLVQPQGPVSFDDTYFVVPLPFTFAYFDRTYDWCYISTNGRVTFRSGNATSFSAADLTAPTSNMAVHNSMFVIGTDLMGYPQDAARSVKAYSETGRVVLQWQDVSFFTGSRTLFLNFQCHLHSNGNIEFHYGPENNPLGLAESPSFCSGIVNVDGTTSFAGFGSVTTLQSARPLANTRVTLAYAGMLGNEVVMDQGLVLPAINVVAPAANVPVLSFGMHAVGSGGTVTDLEFQHASYFSNGDSVTLSLVEDTAPLGQYNGETVIASTTVLNVNTVFSGLSLGVTAGQSRNFLLLAGFTTLGRHYFQTTFHLIQALSPTANLADFRQYQVNFSPAPMVFMSFDQGVDTLPVSQAGATNIVLGSFDLRLVKNQQPRTLTELTFDLASAGAVSAADLANMRLYQDRGTIGALDASDVLLATVAAPTSVNVITGLSIPVSPAGDCYLVVADLAAPTGNVGQIILIHLQNDGIFQAAARPRPICNGATSVVQIWPSADSHLTEWVALPGATDVQAISFTLRALAGTQTVSQLAFSDNSGNGLAAVSSARLYLDNGSIPGRLDAGDTLVPCTLALGAGSFQLSPTTPISLSSIGETYHVGVDLGAGGGPLFRLTYAAISGSFSTVLAQQLLGPTIRPTGNGANGVDVNFSFVPGPITVYSQGRQVLGTAAVTARGTGGAMPIFHFALRNSVCGRGVDPNTLVEIWVEGSGPLGQLDPTDVMSYGMGTWTGFGPGSMGNLPAATTWNLLIVARAGLIPYNETVPGPFTMQFAGISGNEVRAQPAFAVIPGFSWQVNRLLSAPSGPGGKGGSDGGCSTGDGNSHWPALMAALAALLAATRLRRAGA